MILHNLFFFKNKGEKILQTDVPLMDIIEIIIEMHSMTKVLTTVFIIQLFYCPHILFYNINIRKILNCMRINTIRALPTFAHCFCEMSEYSEKCAEKMGLKPL